MRRLSCLFLLLALMLPGIPLRAQWSGSVDLSGGLGGMEGSLVSDDEPMYHGLAQGAFQLNHKTAKFNWSIKVDGKWEPKTTDNSRMAYKNEKLGIVYKSATTKPLSTGIRSDFQWTPSNERNYSTWILYQYSNDRASNHSMTMDGDVETLDKFSYYYEVPVLDEYKVETGLKTFRSFDGGRNVLQSSLRLQAVVSDKVNTWIVFKAGEGEGGSGTAMNVDELEGYAWKYRITPSSKDFSMDGDIHLRKKLRDNEIKLQVTPGARLTVKHALDENSGATRTNIGDQSGEEQWRDSTRLRESFDFLSMWAEPYMTADFQWESIEAHADYACQVYARRLNDNTHQQPLRIKGVYPVGNAKVKWTISPSKALTFSNKMSVSHPDYLKICWYDRTAGYLDQLYRGNEQLLSPETRKYELEYEYKYNRFVSKSAVAFTRVFNEIDQTWSNEEIDGRLYKVFRWINSSDSRSVGLTQKLGWKGKIITANADVTYTQSRRKAKSGDTIKDSFNWVLNADVSANLGKGWKVGTDARYQSKMATFFTLFKQYCRLNARVQKDFKRITLYLEGRDLLDMAMETSFESEELQEFWVEEVRNNRRIYVIGAKWRF